MTNYMHDHGSIGLFLGNGFILVGNLALSVFGLFFSAFVQREANKSPTHRILVGKQRERTTLGRGFFSFHVFLVTILYCSDIDWSKNLSACFFCFLPIFDRGFSFLFAFPLSLIGDFLFLLPFFLFFFSRARFMVNWDFGSRLVARLDMIYVRVWFGSKIKRGCPTLFP